MKMPMRLNGWQRRGVIISVLWAVGVTLSTHSADLDRQIHHVKWLHEVCLSVAVGLNVSEDFIQGNNARCDNFLKEQWSRIDHSWGNALVVGLAPIPFVWFIAFTLAGLFSWIRGGFRLRPRDEKPRCS